MSADIAQTGNICRHHEMSADIARLQMCANIYIYLFIYWGCTRTQFNLDCGSNKSVRGSQYID